MRYALIALGENFRDPELNDLIQKAIQKGHTVKVFAPAIERLQELSASCEFDTIWIETTGCDKKQYVRAINNLISLIFARAKVVCFLPLCPKAILEVAKEQWPGAVIFQVNFKDKGAEPIRLFN